MDTIGADGEKGWYVDDILAGEVVVLCVDDDVAGGEDGLYLDDIVDGGEVGKLK